MFLAIKKVYFFPHYIIGNVIFVFFSFLCVSRGEQHPSLAVSQESVQPCATDYHREEGQRLDSGEGLGVWMGAILLSSATQHFIDTVGSNTPVGVLLAQRLLSENVAALTAFHSPPLKGNKSIQFVKAGGFLPKSQVSAQTKHPVWSTWSARSLAQKHTAVGGEPCLFPLTCYSFSHRSPQAVND